MAQKGWVVEEEKVEEVVEEVAEESEVEEIEIPPVEEKEEIETPQEVESVEVSIDTSVEDVVSYDQRGVKLFFDDSIEGFLKLPQSVVKELGAENKQRYILAAGSYHLNVEEQELPKLEELEINMQMALATSKLELTGKDPSKYYCWKRPDELRAELQRGWQIVKDDKIGTLVSSPSSVHRVGAMGQDELVLVEMSKEKHKAFEEIKKRQNKLREEGPENAFKREVGRNVYQPPKGGMDRRAQFSAPIDEYGEPIENTG